MKWNTPAGAERRGPDRPNAGALKWLWRERRCSSEELDHSGVWRFRELLPILDNFGNAVTLREGNTPLYHLTRASKALGIDQLFAKHQGMNPTGSFKDTGMTAAHERGQGARLRVGGLRFDREHFGLHGRLRRPRRTAEPGADSRGQDRLGQALAGHGLRRRDLPD